MDLLLESNPWFGHRKGHRRAALRRHHRRNPTNPLAGATTLKNWTHGFGVTDIAAAAGGLAASTMLPGMFIKLNAGATELTTMQKVLKVVIGTVAAFAAGAAAKSFLTEKAGQAAAAGGLAGVVAQAVGAFTPYKIGGQPALMAGRTIRRFGEASNVPSYPQGETVQLIQP